MKGNVGTALAKVIVLSGGALVGAILANWLDKVLYERAHEKSEYDKKRYAQGLGPLSPQQPTSEE